MNPKKIEKHLHEDVGMQLFVFDMCIIHELFLYFDVVQSSST